MSSSSSSSSETAQQQQESAPLPSTTSSSSLSSSSRGGAPKSWAAIASQPAKQGIIRPKPKPLAQVQVGFGTSSQQQQSTFSSSTPMPPREGGGGGSSSSSSSSIKQAAIGSSSSGGTERGRGRGWSNQRRAPNHASSSSSSLVGNGPISSSSAPLSPSSHIAGLSSISVSGEGGGGGGASASAAAATMTTTTTTTSGGGHAPGGSGPSVSVLDRLRAANQYNPKDFTIDLKNSRFFVIKSYSEDDIHRSIKYSIWTSTPSGNGRLDRAFHEQNGNPLYLLYSVNGSGHFCGVAQMTTGVDYDTNTGVFTQEKWKGRFDVKWIYVKDVPNNQLRHIRLENNENKPVTNSRDTQEVPYDKGKQILRIVHNYKATTSIFDDFGHYEKRQEEDNAKKVTPLIPPPPPPSLIKCIYLFIYIDNDSNGGNRS